MTPDGWRGIYRRQMDAVGETVTLRRVNTSPTPATDADVIAAVRDFTPDELAAGYDQGSRKVVVLAEDVEESGFPTPFRTGGSDKVVVRGRVLNIEEVDDNTRRTGTLIAYNLVVKG